MQVHHHLPFGAFGPPGPPAQHLVEMEQSLGPGSAAFPECTLFIQDIAEVLTKIGRLAAMGSAQVPN